MNPGLYKILLPLLVLTSLSSFSQQQSGNIPFVKFTKLYGEAKLNGFYREQDYKTVYMSDKNNTTFFSGGGLIRSSNYIWNPNFFNLDAEVEYNPESNDETYLIIPDRSEQRTLGKVGCKGTFFQNKIIGASGFVNYNQSYMNRELLSNIKSENMQYGGMVSLRHKALPSSISFNHTDWNQKELVQDGRRFKMEQDNLQGTFSKSFSDRDINEFTYTHDEFLRKDALTAAIKNKIDNLSLRNELSLDRNKKYNFRSQVNQYYQSGVESLERFVASESFSFDLPKRHFVNLNYSLNTEKHAETRMTQNYVRGSLRKKIYDNLNSGIFYEFSDVNHSAFDEMVNKTGFDLNYTRKIGRHRLNLYYRYQMHLNNMKKNQVDLQIYNEEHMLSDGRIVLLNQPDAVPSTIKVKDENNVIVFQENFDYILVKHNRFVEIQRVPSGQIPNNTKIKVDYVSTNSGSYSFNLNNNAFGTSLFLYGSLLELYYNGSVQGYRNLNNTEFVTLNYYNQNVVGLRLNYGIANGGIEYDVYNSKIVPYSLIRCYGALQKEFFNKLQANLSGNYSRYYLLDDDANQVFKGISGKISYKIASHSKIDFDVTYRSQAGRQINLELLTGGLEYNLTIRQFQFAVGMEMFQKSYIREELGMNSVFFRLVRKFNYNSPVDKMNRLEKSNLELGIR